jgi:hypothetical protein
MNKSLLAALLLAAAPALALAQQPARKPAPKKPLSTEQKKAIEAATPIEEPDPRIKLSEAELEVAKRVHTGDIPCELGATVKVTPMKRDGFFLVAAGRNRFVMHPVESRTGAIRLEDPVRGALWLQLGNKSMLMNQKVGQRLADECQSDNQKVVAEELKKNPINLLEPPKPAASEPAAPAASAPVAPAASAPAKPASN